MAKHWTARARRWWFAQQMKGKKGKGGGTALISGGDKLPPEGRQKLSATRQNLRSAMAEITAHGHAVEISSRRFKEWGAEDSPAAFLPNTRTGSGTIFLNPRHPHWQNPAENAARQHAAGYWSSAHPQHAEWHEIGHAEHFRSNPRAYKEATQHQFDDFVAPRLGARVSEYSRTAGHELVAEVYAGRKAGKVYDAFVINQYTRMRGS